MGAAAARANDSVFASFAAAKLVGRVNMPMGTEERRTHFEYCKNGLWRARHNQDMAKYVGEQPAQPAPCLL